MLQNDRLTAMPTLLSHHIAMFSILMGHDTLEIALGNCATSFADFSRIITVLHHTALHLASLLPTRAP